MEETIMSERNLLGKILGIVMLAVSVTGCSLSFAVKDPVPSSVKYDNNDIKPIILTIVDKRSGSDSVFLVKNLGVGGIASNSLDLNIENMENPVSYFAEHLEREINERGIPIKCVVGKKTNGRLVLLIDRYQIFNHRATGLSPWEACHIFSGTIMEKQKKPIKAYFYNGKMPWWDIDEIEKPCFTIPVSIMIKEVASKICSEVFNLRSSDEKIEGLITIINSETVNAESDPYDRPFWKILELGYTNNPNAMEPLKKYAQDSDPFFSSCALSSMGVLGADDQIEFLLQKYKKGGFNDRYMAAKAIGDIGTQEAIQILRDMKRDPSYTKEPGLKQCLDLYAP
jgi:hypothetical protein